MLTKKKLLTLSDEHAHRLAAKLVREFYEATQSGTPFTSESSNDYLLLCSHLSLPPLTTPSLSFLADRYHLHLKHGKRVHKEHNLLPPVHTTDHEHPRAPSLDIAIYLDNIRSAHNIGSIIRTTEAFNLGSLHFTDQMPPPSHKQIQDAAMSAGEWVTCNQGTPLSSLPHPIIALETSPDAHPIDSFIFPSTPFTLILGNEEYGCSPSSLQAADLLLEIPLYGKKNSLNVANAYTVAAAAIRKHYATLPCS